MINGALTTLNAQDFKFTPFEGSEWGGVYEGEKNAIWALAPSLIALGYHVTFDTKQSRIASLSFRAISTPTTLGGISPANNSYQDSWELVRNTVQKELLESDHPLVAQVTNIASADTMGNLDMLKSWFANPNQGSKNTPPNFMPDFADSNDGATSKAAALYLWQLYASGVKSVEVKQPILRLTRTASPAYSAPFAVSNIDTLFTTASMISDSGVPSSFAVSLSSLATRLVNKSGGNNPVIRSDGLTLYFGWLKDLIDVRKHGKQRTQFGLEYKFGLWDAKLYGVPS